MAYMIGSRKYELYEGWGKLPEGYEFHQVAGVAVDGNDSVYVFNRSSHKLLVFDRGGNLLTVWDQKFVNPHGAHVDREGNVFLVDRDSHVVEKYSPDQELLLTLGTKDEPSDTGEISERFLVERAAGPNNLPTGVTTAADGTIFVSDGYGNCRVHKYDAAGNLLMSWGAPGNIEASHFELPHGISIDNRGRVLVCDRENHRIQIFSQAGDYQGMWTGFRQPTDVVVGPDDTVYVPELQSRVSILNGDGDLLARWGGESSHESGQFVSPHCVAIDSRGDIYIGEVLEGKRVQKFVRV